MQPCSTEHLFIARKRDTTLDLPRVDTLKIGRASPVATPKGRKKKSQGGQNWGMGGGNKIAAKDGEIFLLHIQHRREKDSFQNLSKEKIEGGPQEKTQN